MKAIGRHIILEMWGCQNLESVATAEQALRELAERTDRVGEAARQLPSGMQAPTERPRAARRRAQTTRAS